MGTGTLFEQLGGVVAVEAAVDRFYRKVLDDERIRHFFEDVDMSRQAAKQKAFLTIAFGGPGRYTGRSLRNSHVDLVARGLNDTHFDAVVELLVETLRELGVSEPAIARVGAVAESVRDDVLCREPKAALSA